MKHQQLFKSSLAILLLMLSSLVFSYEIRTHEAFTKKAINNSIDWTDIITTLGIQKEQLFPNPAKMNCFRKTDGCSFLGRGLYNTYAGLILNGSSYEDLETTTRPFNHFYDPVNDRGLTITPSTLGNKNPDWAMRNNTLICVDFYVDGSCARTEQPQVYSYPDAYGYFYKALVSVNPKSKEENFGKMFQSLGQVLHLLQDMAAIEHVRNDAHVASPYFGEFVDKLIKQQSRYEIHTENLIKKGKLPFNGYFSADTPVNLLKARGLLGNGNRRSYCSRW